MYRGGLRLEDVIWIGCAAALVAVLIASKVSGDELTIRETITTRYDVDLSRPAITLKSRESTETREWTDGNGDPPPDTDLAKAAASEAKAIGDGNGPRASIAFTVAAQKVEDGTLDSEDVRKAIRTTLEIVVTANGDQWIAAAERLLDRLNQYAGESRAKFVDGCRQFASGLKSVSGLALPTKAEVLTASFAMQAQRAAEEGWLEWFQFFISEILPLILDLLDGIGD